MKRFARAALGALLLLSIFALPALAEWRLEPIKWTHPGLTSSGTSATANFKRGFVRDTTWLPAFASVADTSAEFSLMDCDPPPPAQFGTINTTIDSLPLAYVVVVADSSVASSAVWDATVALQLNYGKGANWTAGKIGSPLPTAGQGALFAPIWSRLPVVTADLPIDMSSPTLNQAPRCRVIVTGGTNVAVPSMRLYVRKWVQSTAERDAGNTSW